MALLDYTPILLAQPVFLESTAYVISDGLDTRQMLPTWMEDSTGCYCLQKVLSSLSAVELNQKWQHSAPLRRQAASHRNMLFTQTFFFFLQKAYFRNQPVVCKSVIWIMALLMQYPEELTEFCVDYRHSYVFNKTALQRNFLKFLESEF